MAAINNMLLVGPQHLCKSTKDMLETESIYDACIPGYDPDIPGFDVKHPRLMLTVGRYGDFAWIILVPRGHPMETEGMPADLCHIMLYAQAKDCRYLMIDMDMEPNPDLPVYPEE